MTALGLTKRAARSKGVNTSVYIYWAMEGEEKVERAAAGD